MNLKYLENRQILSYERYPDQGGAAVWYAKAFGIGGDDDGGTGLQDWQRVDLLRQDLVEPAYNYTEFSQLYHSPTKAQVAAAVNDGRSLGLYIGHGAETYWVTSGFDVSDVNTMLSNDEMLPVIWDVTCVNGKLYCMDVNRDGNVDEGTTSMEQSTLFGTCTTWMRTLLPQSYELLARPDGWVSLDDGAYGCSGTVTVGVSDSNVPGSSPSTIDTLQITLAVPGDSTAIILTETAPDRSPYWIGVESEDAIDNLGVDTNGGSYYEGAFPCDGPSLPFADGFESGGCSVWSAMVP